MYYFSLRYRGLHAVHANIVGKHVDVVEFKYRQIAVFARLYRSLPVGESACGRTIDGSMP